MTGAVGQHGSPRVCPVAPPAAALIRALTPGLLLALLVGIAPALAAPKPGSPATEDDMTLYTRIAAVNVCISRTAEIPFDKAAAIAGETMAQVIQHQHGGLIRQVGSKPLTLEELRKGSINSAVLGAAEVCPKEVPAEVMRNVEAAMQRSQGSEAIPPPAQPAAPAPRR